MQQHIPHHWRILGVPVYKGKWMAEQAQKKITGSAKLLESGETIGKTDLIYLNIDTVPIFCVDVDNIGDSIKRFHELLESNNDTLDNYVHEKTRHGGYHLFFHSEEKIKNIMHKDYQGIHIDVIFEGRLFTYPSSFVNLSYELGTKNIGEINSLADLGEIPEWLDDLLCQPDI
jgi:hypothetical protein